MQPSGGGAKRQGICFTASSEPDSRGELLALRADGFGDRKRTVAVSERSDKD
jgi:hypothetical protein